MTTFPNSPKLLKGGIVLIDPDSGSVQRIIVLQYNPDTLSRSFQVKGVGTEGGDRSEALRLTGPPVETIKLEAEIDATDQLEFPSENPLAPELGIHPQLAVLEGLVYPASSDLQSTLQLAHAGTIEIAPMEAPLSLFVWSKNRVLPVRLTELNVNEEAFDVNLNPIRANVSLGLRVLSTNDLPDTHKGAGLFLAYHQQKERLAAKYEGGSLGALGISKIG
jgi:hypothetical protein